MEQFRIDHGCYTLTCGGASAFQYALPGDECIEL